MKKILLLLTVLFSFSVNAQTVMWAIDLKDGAEDDYLKLEEFYSEIHKEGLKQGLRSGWSVWKRTPQEGDEANQAEYVIFDNFSSTEQMEGNGTSNEELAQIAYKGKMSKRAITKMLETTGSYSRERRTYVLEAVDYTILSGGNIKPGDKATINLMTKKTDDFESYESEIWKPIAEKNIMKGSLRQWVLANLRGNPDIEGQELSGFIWEKLWEGIESSRDMQDANEFTCVFAVN